TRQRLRPEVTPASTRRGMRNDRKDTPAMTLPIPTRTFSAALVLLGLVVPALADSKPAEPAAPAPPPAPTEGGVKLEVFPPAVNLATARARQSVVAQATYADGITRDVTAQATLTVANPGLVRRDRATFYPVAEGATTLTVAFGGRTVTLPLKV